ncbi:hypothetical protein C8Q74DRAFT_1301403, partial [Fomes fomentarius]
VPSSISPPGGIRRSRRVSLRLLPLLVSRPHEDAGRQVDEPTPFWSSHLSGTGDSDCAECARRIARLSLRMRPPTSGSLSTVSD